MMKFLTRIRQRVKVFGENGQELFLEVDSVVPQGINLCPTLINVFIDDDLEATKNKKSLYVED